MSWHPLSGSRPALSKSLCFGAFIVVVSSIPAFAQTSQESSKDLVKEALPLIKQTEYKLARKKLEEAVKLDPTSKWARKNLAIVYNNLALKEKTPQSALKLVHLAVYNDRGNAAILRFQDNLIKLMKKNPKSFRDRVSLGDEARAAGDLIGAEIEFHAALKIKSSRKVLDRLGGVARQQLNLPASKSGPMNKTQTTASADSSRDDQVYVIDKTRLVQNMPRAVRIVNEINAVQSAMDKAVADGNTMLSEANAQNVPVSQALYDQIQNKASSITRSSRQKIAKEEKSIESILDEVAEAESKTRNIPRSRVKWSADYNGSDAIDITDSAIAKVQSIR